MNTQIPHVNVGLAVMTTLRNYGIDTIFGIPGTHNLEFYRHLAPLNIHPVTTRHEQGAGYGADGWSQRTGQPGVVITTSGPGLLNALSAAGTAYCESRPMLILSPGAPRGMEFSDVGALHETKDATGAAGSIVHWSRRVTSGQEAVAAVHDAFELFRHGRPRPVHIEVPLDVLESAFEPDAGALAARPRRKGTAADSGAVRRAAALLAAARNPVILAGGGSLNACAELLVLAEKLQAAVVTTINGKGAIPETHPLSLGCEIRLPAAQDLCNSADVLLIVGSKVGESELWGGRIDAAGRSIRVDILESQLSVNVGADIGLAGDASVVIRQLLDELDTATRPEPRELSGLRGQLRADARALAPDLAEISEIVASVVPPGTIIAGDSSQITYLGTTSFIPSQEPHQLLYTPAYATLGYGLPAAIGAKIADPGRTVLCLLGDGALMFSVQELITAVEQGITLTVICVDNGGYGEIRQNMADRSLSPVGVDLVQPDWATLANAFGARGVTVDSVLELPLALKEALESSGTTLLHLRIGAGA